MAIPFQSEDNLYLVVTGQKNGKREHRTQNTGDSNQNRNELVISE